MTALEITVLRKADSAPLTKRIALAPDGTVISDGSACVMSRGAAQRFGFARIDELAKEIETFTPDQALTLGALRPDLLNRVEIVTKRKLNGAKRLDIVARTRDYFTYRTGHPALALLDYDPKGMPPNVADKITGLGGLWPALLLIIPELAETKRLVRRSTSAGLFRSDTGKALPASDGTHIFLALQDGSDVERFLKTLHERCWLAGLGWMMVGAGGQLLERSIVDRVVGAPERLVFEGAPVLDPPLAQDKESRRPVTTEGDALNSFSVCPDLSILERSKLRELRAKEISRLEPEAAAARMAFVGEKSHRLAVRTGMAPHLASKIIERQCEGILLPDVVLPFDDDDLVGSTVADVLADPARFEDATLADPLEGIQYGRGKAKIMRRADGLLWIHSFAHGRTVYELKPDARAATSLMREVPKEEAAATFVRLVLSGDLSEDEIEELRNIASERTGITKRTLDRRLKQTRKEIALRRAMQERRRRLAERKDPRPLIPAPSADAEWLPIMDVLNGVLGKSEAIEPPMRDFEGYLVEGLARRVPGLHGLTALGANQEETEETRLPPPEHLLLTRLGEPEVAELIERHIEFRDLAERPVHLATPFVKHFIKRSDRALPLCTGISTLPLVLPDGTILSGPGLVRSYHTLFRVPQELRDLLPKQEHCTAPAVSCAMRFLTHNWLCDVATDYAGRCIIIALALAIIERALLPTRPAFFIEAGKRGGGKTTALNMISTAVLGQTAAAAAWSPNEEERRKALFAYFLEGVPFLVWDNIARGTTISCPSIEKSLTAEFYSDRVLGVSESRLVPITTIQSFTGNNIAPRGDMGSRSLRAALNVDRPDPENRDFKHPAPIGWTKANRGRILTSLYTILLGNPRRRGHRDGNLESRFKEFMDLIGTAVEHAAEICANEVHDFVAAPLPSCPPAPISFKDMFLAGEADDQENAGLATLLCALRSKWFQRPFQAKNVSAFLDPPENVPPTDDARDMLASLALAAGKPIKNISSSAITWCLKKLANAPVQVGDEVLTLKCTPDRRDGDVFQVVSSVDPK